MTLNEIEANLEVQNISGSVKTGLVGEIDGEVYRVLYSPSLVPNIEKLKKIVDLLFDIGLIKTEFLGRTSRGHYVLKHEKFDHQTYIQEWTHQQKKDAVIMTLRLQRALWKNGFSLHDPHINNVTFVGHRPVYFDFDSIHYDKPDMSRVLNFMWHGRRRPAQGWGLHLGADKAMMDNIIYKYKDPIQMLTEAIKLVKELEPKFPKTQWSNYKQALPKGMDINKPETHRSKYGDATRMFEKHLDGEVRTMLDLGASRGVFTRCMLANGVEKVMAVDIDEAVIDQFYKETKEEQLPVTCAYYNVMDNLGAYANHRESPDRFQCDLVLCIALIHHMCYFRNVSLHDFADRMARFTKKFLMIEWVPDSDRCLTGKVNKFGVEKPTYTEAVFRKAFHKDFELIAVEGMTPDPRKVFLYRKRPGTESPV